MLSHEYTINDCVCREVVELDRLWQVEGLHLMSIASDGDFEAPAPDFAALYNTIANCGPHLQHLTIHGCEIPQVLMVRFYCCPLLYWYSKDLISCISNYKSSFMFSVCRSPSCCSLLDMPSKDPYACVTMASVNLPHLWYLTLQISLCSCTKLRELSVLFDADPEEDEAFNIFFHKLLQAARDLRVLQWKDMHSDALQEEIHDELVDCLEPGLLLLEADYFAYPENAPLPSSLRYLAIMHT